MIHFNLNGQSVEVDLESQTPLINVLRDHFGLFGTRNTYVKNTNLKIHKSR